MKIYYITGNKRKIEIAQDMCQNTIIEIEQIEMDTPEIQGLDSNEIAKYSAKFIGEKLCKPVVKLDVSFHINALNGFPGPFIKYINEWLSPEYILKMMDGIQDRSCYWQNSLAYYDKGQLEAFDAKEEGVVSLKAKGENGWGMDKIFIPKGYIKTKAELSDKERVVISNKDHWRQFIEFIQNNG